MASSRFCDALFCVSASAAKSSDCNSCAATSMVSTLPATSVIAMSCNVLANSFRHVSNRSVNRSHACFILASVAAQLTLCRNRQIRDCNRSIFHLRPVRRPRPIHNPRNRCFPAIAQQPVHGPRCSFSVLSMACKEKFCCSKASRSAMRLDSVSASCALAFASARLCSASARVRRPRFPG